MRRTYSKPLWLIVRHRTGGMETLKTPLTMGGEALPVFSFEDEARMFLWLGMFDDDWRIRETGAGEVISMLYSLCAGVDSLVLDPLPVPFAGSNGFLSMEREAFMDFACEKGRGAPLVPIFLANRAGQSSGQYASDIRPSDATTRMATLERR